MTITAIPIDEAERLDRASRAKVLDSTPSASLMATPYRCPDPASIPPRKWLFGRHACRKFISATVAAGGTGKTANAIAEQLAFVSGRDLLADNLKSSGRAWYIGLEDPLEEYERRVAACALHHGLADGDLGGLFLDSGRNQDFVIAREDRGGVTIAVPVVEAISAQIRKHDIGLVTVDPFVASHMVRENDNGSIEVVARTWAGIADATGAAIELIHHVRKMAPGQEISADDARGARSLVDKARSVRLLTAMTAEEGLKAGVEERRRYFRMSFGKANLTLAPDDSIWRQLASVSLGNGGGGPDDIIGVAAPWAWPNPLDDISVHDLEAVRVKISIGEWRADVQAKNWAGHAVAEVLELDLSDDAAKATVKSLLKTWTKNGALRIDRRTDPKRRDLRDFVVAGA